MVSSLLSLVVVAQQPHRATISQLRRLPALLRSLDPEFEIILVGSNMSAQRRDALHSLVAAEGFAGLHVVLIDGPADFAALAWAGCEHALGDRVVVTDSLGNIACWLAPLVFAVASAFHFAYDDARYLPLAPRLRGAMPYHLPRRFALSGVLVAAVADATKPAQLFARPRQFPWQQALLVNHAGPLAGRGLLPPQLHRIRLAALEFANAHRVSSLLVCCWGTIVLQAAGAMCKVHQQMIQHAPRLLSLENIVPVAQVIGSVCLLLLAKAVAAYHNDDDLSPRCRVREEFYSQHLGSEQALNVALSGQPARLHPMATQRPPPSAEQRH